MKIGCLYIAKKDFKAYHKKDSIWPVIAVIKEGSFITASDYSKSMKENIYTVEFIYEGNIFYRITSDTEFEKIAQEVCCSEVCFV